LELLQPLQRLGITIERCSDILVALSMPVGTDFDGVYAVLDNLAEQKVLEYETCEADDDERPGLFDEFTMPTVRPM